MRIESIKAHLKGQTIIKRKSTVSAAFASALAPFDAYDLESVAAGLRDLGQDPNGELTCAYCGQEAATWDHVFRRVVQGEFSGYGHLVRNLIPCCRTCNERKGGKPWRTWLAIAAPLDETTRAERIERFLAHAAAQPLTDEMLAAAAPVELDRFKAIRDEVFRLFAEADALAETIRLKVAQSPR